jgi:hypothetical protein
VFVPAGRVCSKNSRTSVFTISACTTLGRRRYLSLL